jgi:two-component system chemotaxis sensor kinase CheA
MDVVKTNVEQINGTVEIQNRKGLGTSIRICIPLTLAIIPALMVTAADRKYAIPQTNVIELLGLRDLEFKHQIERAHGIAFCRLRGRLLQLISLSTVLDEDLSLQDVPQIPPDGGRTTVVVVHSQDSQFGLIVDEVTDNQEIVVKPAGKYLKEAGIYAGATIVGNGSVALILDVRSLARLVSPVTDGTAADSLKAEILEETPAQALEQLLLLECSNKERVAIPLSEVVRLEEFAPCAIETVGEQEAVQYLDSVLPLIRLANLISENPLRKNAEILDKAPEGNIPVVVCSKNNSSFGLIVGRMLDIVEHRVAAVESPVSLFGFAGMATAVIQGRVTRLLDLKRLIQLVRVPGHLELAVGSKT